MNWTKEDLEKIEKLRSNRRIDQNKHRVSMQFAKDLWKPEIGEVVQLTKVGKKLFQEDNEKKRLAEVLKIKKDTYTVLELGVGKHQIKLHQMKKFEREVPEKVEVPEWMTLEKTETLLKKFKRHRLKILKGFYSNDDDLVYLQYKNELFTREHIPS